MTISPKRPSVRDSENEALLVCGSPQASHARDIDGNLTSNNRQLTAGTPGFVAHPDNDNDEMPPINRSFSSVDMRARMALALEEHLHDHPDIAARYERTLSIEGTSPKPCIVPGNALQLIDDDPDAPQSTSPSVIYIGSDHPAAPIHDSPITPDTSSAEPEHEQERRPIPRVRFRSRVRITSGLRRHRHSTSNVGGTAGSATPSSSASGSPSSSISAPLRWQADENATWGPLGRRLSAYAHSNGWQNRSQTVPGQVKQGSQRGIHSGRTTRGLKPNERTPLITPGRARVAYIDSGLDGGGDADDERARLVEYEETDEEEEDEMAMRAAALRREEEAVFGKWPWRLFNRHWWWWHVEPVLCCCCSDESDYEE